MGSRPCVVAISFPAQGHVGPLMKLSCQIADCGVRVVFVTAESIHSRVLEAPGEERANVSKQVEIVSIPDGVSELKDRSDRRTVAETMSRVMPGSFKALLRRMESSGDEKVSCVIADATVGWALEVAETLGIRRTMFWPSVVRGLVLSLHAPQLVEAGVIDHRGMRVSSSRFSAGASSDDEMIQLPHELPSIRTSDFIWNCPGDPIRQEILFGYVLSVSSTVKICDWVLCNSFDELDGSVCHIVPKLLPVGPLLHSLSCKKGNDRVNFWKEDETCINWLDRKPNGSVIYVAFGSIAVFSQVQFEELALGLELSGRLFLWVVRPDSLDGKTGTFSYPDAFLERVAGRGKIVSWAPQETVLSHPSVACFLTHCGWNSTVEGLSCGVPFLCWPYFADQFFIRSYVCDVLEVGLKLEVVEASGIVTRHEIVQQLGKLISDTKMKENVQKIKAMARKSVSEHGPSFRNLQYFVEQLKNC